MRTGREDLVPAAPPPAPGRVRGNPRRYSDEAYVRRVELVARFSFALAALSLGVAAVMATTLLGLLPLKEKEHVLVQFDEPTAQLVRLIPERIDRRTEDQLIENSLRRYVEDRETINLVDEEVRYGWVQAYSSEKVSRAFQEQMMTSNPESPLNEFAKKKLTREIHILSAGRVPGSGGTWQVEFTTIDRRNQKAVQRGEWVATLAVRRGAIEGPADVVRLNPLGVRVTGYAVRQRSIGTAEVRG